MYAYLETQVNVFTETIVNKVHFIFHSIFHKWSKQLLGKFHIRHCPNNGFDIIYLFESSTYQLKLLNWYVISYTVSEPCKHLYKQYQLKHSCMYAYLETQVNVFTETIVNKVHFIFHSIFHKWSKQLLGKFHIRHCPNNGFDIIYLFESSTYQLKFLNWYVISYIVSEPCKHLYKQYFPQANVMSAVCVCERERGRERDEMHGAIRRDNQL